MKSCRFRLQTLVITARTLGATVLLIIPFFLGCTGGSDGPSCDVDVDATSNACDPPVIHTGEMCKVDGDCKMVPAQPFCRDSKTAVRYESATCGGDQRCAWSPLVQRCDLRCEDGYCITAAAR